MHPPTAPHHRLGLDGYKAYCVIYEHYLETLESLRYANTAAITAGEPGQKGGVKDTGVVPRGPTKASPNKDTGGHAGPQLKANMPNAPQVTQPDTKSRMSKRSQRRKALREKAKKTVHVQPDATTVQPEVEKLGQPSQAKGKAKKNVSFATTPMPEAHKLKPPTGEIPEWRRRPTEPDVSVPLDGAKFGQFLGGPVIVHDPRTIPVEFDARSDTTAGSSGFRGLGRFEANMVEAGEESFLTAGRKCVGCASEWQGSQEWCDQCGRKGKKTAVMTDVPVRESAKGGRPDVAPTIADSAAKRKETNSLLAKLRGEDEPVLPFY